METYFEHFSTAKYQERSWLKRFFIKSFLYNITELFESINPQSTLELGCGEGFVCGYLQEQHPTVSFYGVDQNAQQLERLHEHFPHITTYRADITQPLDMLSPRTYDLVMALEVLEHLSNPAPVLRAMRTLTKRYILLSVPWEPWFQLSNLARGRNVRRFGNDSEHLHHWTKQSIVKLVSRNYKIRSAQISFPWTIILAEK